MLTRLRVGIGARVVAFLFVCLILGSAVGVWAIGRYHEVAGEISNDMAQRSSDLAESLKTQVIRNAYMTLSAMSGFQRVQGKNPPDCADVASFFLKNSTGYINVGAVLPDGTIYCAAQSAAIGMNVKDQDWFKSALTTGQFTMGGIQASDIIHSYIVTFGLPLKDENGNVTQVLGLTTQIEYIARVLAFPHLPNGTSLTVIDQYGNVLVSNSSSQSKSGDSIANWAVAKRAMKADEPFVMNWTGSDGVDRVYAVTSSRVSEDAVPRANHADIRAFSIIVGIPARSIALSIMGPVQSAGIAIGLVFLLILAGIYFFVTRTLVKPIKEIQSMAERLTFGDLTARVINKSRAGEVRSLADAFNTMAATLAKREDDIRTSNIRFQRIFETEPAGVALLDHELKVIDINQAGLDILNADNIDQIRGHTMPMLVIDEDFEKFRQHLHTVRSGKTDSVSLQIVDMKGRRRWQKMQSATIKFADDTPAGFISIVRDTTDEIATEAQLVQAQKMESIGRLTGGVAHDFNNLLTIVMGNAEILIEELDEHPKLKKLATMIEAAAQRGAELTHRMLAFARRQVLRPTQLDTNVLLNRIVDMMGHLLGEDIQVRIEASDGLWRIAADPA
jgi:PAS domain S-box-containing protein